MFLDTYKNKVKQTNLERYGGTSAMACDEIKQKVRETNIMRYGVAIPAQNTRPAM